MKRSAWDSLVGRVYDAALDHGLWPQAMAEATEVIGARQAKLAMLDFPATEVANLVIHRIDPALDESWRGEFVFEHGDPWTEALYDSVSFATAGSCVVPPDELRRTPCYNEILRHDGVEDTLLGSLHSGPEARSYVGFFHDQLFTRRQLEVFRRLMPHLRRALAMQRQLLVAQDRARSVENALDRLRAGVVILDTSGRVVFCNRKAEEILAEPGGLTQVNRRLCCAQPLENRELDAAVSEATAASRAKVVAHARSLAVTRSPLRRPLSLSLVRVRDRDPISPLLPRDQVRRAAVLVVITDPEDVTPLPAEQLACLFALTPAEARLAAALAARQSLDEYAESAAITIGTARWTLKRVLEKTGCRRQSELVQLVATSVAGLTRQE